MSIHPAWRLTRIQVVYTMLLFCFALVCGCGGGSSNIHGDGNSGVRGVVTRSSAAGSNALTPAANLTIVIQQPLPQPSGELSAVQLGPVLAQTQTDSQGNYSIALAPGNYAVTALLQPQLTSASNISRGVAVQSRQYAILDIQIPSTP